MVIFLVTFVYSVFASICFLKEILQKQDKHSK